MAEEVTLSIYRGTRESGAMVEYTVPRQPGMVVLDAIHSVQGLHAPDLLDHLAAVTLRCARNTASLSAGCLLNEVEHHGLLLGVEPIPCLRKPDAALGAERL